MYIPGYKIHQQIGEGGMATAYLCVQESLGRLVVLKVLNTSKQQSSETTERFMNEAKIVASLNHPNVITIFDIGKVDDFIYMSMEYLDGGDLRSKMRNPISPLEAIDILVKVGSGLNIAHKKGIVHRDVKPGNILFRKDGTPVLSDFGIAKQLTVDHDLTATGIFLGSPNYMAPEQAEISSIDGRADIYSLGIIFYEMLTGVKPFQSDSIIDIIVQHKQSPIPKLPAGLEQYQPLLNLMVAKKRKDRFRDVDSMLHYIRHMQQSGFIKTTSEIRRKPDFDISGEHEKTLDRGQKVQTIKVKKSKNHYYALASLLGLCLIGYGILFYIEYSMNKPAINTVDRYSSNVGNFNLKSPGKSIAIPKLSPHSSATQEKPDKNLSASSSEVVKALLWLAEKSLEDYRLTHPPKDNAYYYYSRLLEIDANNKEAMAGYYKIAQRFAFLAEHALASNDIHKVRNYVNIGLQFDPSNKTLITLQSLARSKPKGVFEAITEFFTGN